MKTFKSAGKDSEDDFPLVPLEDLRRGSFYLYDADISDSEGDDFVPNIGNSDLNDSPTSENSSSTKEGRHSAAKSDSEYIPITGKRKGVSGRSFSTRSAPEARPTSLSRKYPDKKDSKSYKMVESETRSILTKDNGPLGLIDLAREPELPSLKETKIKDNPQIFHQKHVIHSPTIDESDALVISTQMLSFSPISCDCNLDLSKFKVLIDHSFQTNIDNLWKILHGSIFSTKGFMRSLWAEMGYKGIKVSAWEPEGAGSQSPNENILLEDIQVGYTQNLEYLVPSVNPLGPKEIQTFVKNRVISKEPGNSTICLLQISSTPFVTSGDCFEVHMRTCLTYDGHGISKLRVAVQVIFIKSTWIRSKLSGIIYSGY
jgi:hypothetical protein